MISEKQMPELRAYRRLEHTLPVESEPSLARLVVAGSNEQLPVHRWFRFKEAFSADLLRTLLESFSSTKRKTLQLLDPFCGIGTSLLSTQELSWTYAINSFGIERNPFIYFVARTKVNWPLMDSSGILEIGHRVLEVSAGLRPEIPKLSSLTTGRCMSRHVAQRLVAIREAILRDGASPNHDALLLGVGASVEQLSKTRKDGRALRIVSRDRQYVSTIVLDKWREIASDVRFMQQIKPREVLIPKVILGDGRMPRKCGIGPASIDLVLTSPPYPNNIDYSEVYKLELWLLGFVNNPEDFLGLRKTTFRSHPSALQPQPSDEFRKELEKGALKCLLAPILNRTRSSPDRYRYRLILGYASDLWSALREQYECLKPGGFSVTVVGNSLHGGKHLPYLIPTDLIVSTIGHRLGFNVERVVIARNFRRRLTGNHFLRESVIILRKE